MSLPGGPTEPLHNPGVTPTTPTPPYGPGRPEVGAGEEPQRTFALPPEAAPGGQLPGAVESNKPSPMDIARDGGGGGQRMTPEDLGEKISNLQQTLQQAQSTLQNSSVTKNLTDDHKEALQKLTDKLNPDFRTIANHSGGTFEPPKMNKDNILSKIGDWLDGSQGTMAGALSYVSDMKDPNPASYMKLQWAVQRASQRAELFSSIIGSTVGGIKTIMSTQL